MLQETEIRETLWTAQRTAKILSCSVQHVLRMAVLGMLPAIDLSPPGSRQRMWRFRPEAVEAWLAERERSGKRKR